MLAEINWFAAGERNGTQPRPAVDAAARILAAYLRGNVSQDHNGKLQSLGLVDRHHADALAAFFENGCLSGFCSVSARAQLLHEAPEGQTPGGFVFPSQLRNMQHVGQHLLARGAQRESQMCPGFPQQPVEGFRHRTVITIAMQFG